MRRAASQQAASAGRDEAAISVDFKASADVAMVEPLWRRLEGAADGGFFLSWDWIGSWLTTLADQGGSASLVVARRDARIVGVALLGRRTVRRHRVLPVRMLYLNESGDPARDVVTIEYNDVLAARGDEVPVRRACLTALLSRRDWDALFWRGCASDLPPDVAGLPLLVRSFASAGSARVDLAALRAAGQDYLDSLPPSARRQIRRSMALYRERGPLLIEAAGDVGQAREWFRAAGELHRARWAARGIAGAFDHPFYVRMHERLIAQGLERGAVELLRVTAGGAPIGYLYNFRWRGWVGYYLGGFVFEADNRLKPGLVTHAMAIEHHLAAGSTVYDLMAGDDAYKARLAAPGPRIDAYILERRRLLVRLEAGARSLKRRLDGGCS